MKKYALLVAAGAVLLTSGCASQISQRTGASCQNLATAEGGLIGAGIGALAGKFIGGNTAGALAGALIGGAGGAVAGNQLAADVFGCEEKEAIAQAMPSAANASVGDNVTWQATNGSAGVIQVSGGYMRNPGKQELSCRPVVVSVTKAGKTTTQADQYCEPVSQLVTSEGEAYAKPYASPAQAARGQGA